MKAASTNWNITVTLLTVTLIILASNLFAKTEKFQELDVIGPGNMKIFIGEKQSILTEVIKPESNDSIYRVKMTNFYPMYEDEHNLYFTSIVFYNPTTQEFLLNFSLESSKIIKSNDENFRETTSYSLIFDGDAPSDVKKIRGFFKKIPKKSYEIKGQGIFIPVSSLDEADDISQPIEEKIEKMHWLKRPFVIVD